MTITRKTAYGQWPDDWEILARKGLQRFDELAAYLRANDPNNLEIHRTLGQARGAYEAFVTHANGPLP